MKTILFALLLITAPLHAAPPAITLECDPNPPGQLVTAYRWLERTGTAPAFVYRLMGSTPLPKFVLPPLPTAVPHTFVVRAANATTESGDSNAVTLPAGPTVPLGLKIQVEIVIPPQ